MTSLTLESIVDWLLHRGDGLYGGEAVTQLEHALQCAALASENKADNKLVIAALLHDIFHLAPDTSDRHQPHEQLAALMLADLFPAAVTEPVRMHVDAKRYLCAIDPLYWGSLSDMSKRSLEWQGGPFSTEQAANFISQPYAENAVRLRRWDDAAKVVGKVTPSLNQYIPLMQHLIREHAAIA
ncbi:HD domain-containing protein [Noviherbaspirillum sp. Root189]|uniref:HD domain-containing protein n=1 Tax=Noviherbaspirillum sp. Root189 TaxID=1736487 RepID=UPI0007095261|nr:HD domain-containing protein [Noviherbaspirillum sp. Root189]KRB93136.1 hypothetical protein ASE07_14310 [Noviherbaspirillum sp. Root189]